MAKAFGLKLPKYLRVRGSGVLLDNKGKVVTANHVVGFSDIRSVIGITTDGKKIGCKVLAQDSARDLALLACDGLSGVAGVDGLYRGIIPTGTRIVAAGCAGGREFIISDGIIANNQDQAKLLCSVLSGPGESGGAIFTYDGKLIGIIQAGYMEPPFTLVTTSTLQLQKFLAERYAK